jgi:hypothetical protein
MAKGKKQLMSSAPWRGEEDTTEQFPDANLKVTSQSDGTSTMHVPRSKSNTHNHDDDDGIEIDPELRYSFQRNYQVFFSSNSYLFSTYLQFCFVKETQIRL